MITKIEALSFLKEHQPMPCDEDLSNNEIEMYEEVRKFFLANPDEECISLFLNSFGGKDGLGVYQMVEDVIMMYDKNIVLPYLLKGISSMNDNVRYWCIQIASNFPDDSLFEPLVGMLQSEDDDIRLATINSLAQLSLDNKKVKEVIRVMEDEVEKEKDEDIREFVEEILFDIQESI